MIIKKKPTKRYYFLRAGKISKGEQAPPYSWVIAWGHNRILKTDPRKIGKRNSFFGRK